MRKIRVVGAGRGSEMSAVAPGGDAVGAGPAAVAGALGTDVGASVRILAGETAAMPVGSLRLHPRNPRRGNVEAIKQSLARNGQYTPVTVNRSTMHVLRGNHTLKAARELGWTEIAAYLIDVPEGEEARILLADNRTSDLGTYDLCELTELLLSLGDLSGSGYEQADLGQLLDELDAGVPVAEDDVPPLPKVPLTRPGELIHLGPHRLVCGDARDPASYQRLLGAEQAALLVTDPPYGVDYVGKTADRLRLANDHAAAVGSLLEQTFELVDPVLAAAAPLSMFHPGGPPALDFLQAFTARWQLRQSLVWAKDSFVLGHSDYHYQHEPIAYGIKPAAGRHGRGGAGWYGDNRQSSLLQVPRPRAAREHPTMKPPELLAILLRNSSGREAVVLDPFAGSGSLLIACHQLGRQARLIELDAGYCDVIVARWEQLTGVPAAREAV